MVDSVGAMLFLICWNASGYFVKHKGLESELSWHLLAGYFFFLK